MQLFDALTLDASRRNQDGYMAVRAKSARVGVYDYLGREIDPEGKTFAADQIVKVYRPAEEVFAKDSLASFVAKPITDNHPTVAVDARNWRQHARGTVFGAVEDGDYVSFDLAFMDASLIEAIDSGKRELSNGYSCDLRIEDGIAPDGTAYHAVQRNIRGNHCAVVDRGRAGSDCRVNDRFPACDANPAAVADLKPTEKPMKTMLIDGLTVDVSNADTAEATIKTLIASRDAAGAKVAGLETQVATLTAAGQTKDAQITTLEQQVKDAKPTPAQLREAGKSLMQTADKAKTLGIAVTDAMDEAQIMRATVDKHMGEKAKDWSDESIAASFAVLTKDAKPAAPGVQPLGAPVVIGDAEAAFADAQRKASEERRNAWKTPATSAAA